MRIGANGPGDVTLGTGDRALALTAVKQVLRAGLSDEDVLIAALVESALGLAERFIGRVTIARSMTERLKASGAWQALGAVPVRTIGAVMALAGDVPSALGVGDYAIDVDARGGGWVRVPGRVGQVSVAFEAGLAADWAGLPAPLRQGVVLLAAQLFTMRDPREAPPAAVTALWRPFRAMTLGSMAMAGAGSC
jgi:uncharacterized phiE125 gp8 family phage protein